jgi:hypothetical protein
MRPVKQIDLERSQPAKINLPKISLNHTNTRLRSAEPSDILKERLSRAAEL